MYSHMHTFIDQNCLLILDRDRLEDFYELCINNLDPKLIQYSESLSQNVELAEDEA
jgi:hypothetical protein